MTEKKIVIYASVIEDHKGRAQFPFGIAQFQSFLNSVIGSRHKYRHAIPRANEGDIMIWAFRDDEKEKGCWYLLGDGFITNKYREKKEDWWTFIIEGGRLYPRMIKLEDLSFSNEVKKNIRFGAELTWNQYKELLDKASEPVLESTK